MTSRMLLPVARSRPGRRAIAGEGRTLSPREQQTLALLVTGLTDKEIASRLGISPHTVNQ